MATDEGGELRRGEHVVNQNTDSPRVVTQTARQIRIESYLLIFTPKYAHL